MYMATALLATTLYGLQMVELGSLGDPEYLPHDSKVNKINLDGLFTQAKLSTQVRYKTQ